MGKKKNIVVKKGLDGWVMTYGDMMSLLLTFFVLIVSFSSMQEAKFKQAAQSLKEAFGVMAMPESVIELERRRWCPTAPATSERPGLPLRGARTSRRRSWTQQLDQRGPGRDPATTACCSGSTRPFLFASGAAELRPEATPLLDRLGRMFRQVPRARSGSRATPTTCPCNSARFPSNWELSAARAGGRGTILSRAGPGRPGAPGGHRITASTDRWPTTHTAEGRAKNRRVEIFLKVDRKRPARRSPGAETAQRGPGRDGQTVRRAPTR